MKENKQTKEKMKERKKIKICKWKERKYRMKK